MNVRFFTLVIALCLSINYLYCQNIWAQNNFALEWAKSTGGKASENALSAIDREGNIYLVGTFEDTIDADPGVNVHQLIPLRPGIRPDMYVCKLSATGDFIWAKQIGNSKEETEFYTNFEGGIYPIAIAVDDSANVYITGEFMGMVDFDPGADTFDLETYASSEALRHSFRNVFALKLDSAGSFGWAQVMGGGFKATQVSRATWSGGITASKSGDAVYVVGHFGSEAYFGKDTLISQSESFNAFVSRLDKQTGEFVWSKPIASRALSKSSDVKTDAKGNIYISGHFRDTTDFDLGQNKHLLVTDTVQTYIAIRDAYVISYADNPFVLKVTPQAEFVWAKKLGGKRTVVEGYPITKIDVDATGNVYVAGNAVMRDSFKAGPFLLQGYLPTSSSQWDVYFAKIDTSGNFAWAKAITGKRSERLDNIRLEATHTAFYFTGTFGDTIDFNPGADTFYLKSKYFGGTLYLAKFDTSGNFVWAKQFNEAVGAPANSNASPKSISTHHLGYLYLSGGVAGSINFHPIKDSTFNLTSTPSATTQITSDIFALKLWDCISLQNAHLTAIAEDSICPGTIYTVNINPVIGSNGYSWAAPTGWSVDNITENKIDFIAGQPGEVKIRAVGLCDSSVEYSITVEHRIYPVVITVNEKVLSTTNDYDSWQWLLNGQPIAGATEKSYTPTVNGEYSVVVTQNECRDTSDIYGINNATGIDGRAELTKLIQVYPNPTEDLVYIKSSTPVRISFLSVDGKVILKANNSSAISIKDWANGTYFLQIFDSEDRLIQVEKIVKQ